MIAPSATTAPPSFGHVPVARDAAREAANLEIVRRYLAAIEAGSSESPGGQETFFAPDVIQEEFPNRFVPNGARRDLAALREAAARGRGVMRGQRYEVHAAYAAGDTVILEILWVGTLAVPVGALAAGDEMRAHFAVFIELRDGQIVRQRNYDCFEPF
jgi:ketosteroid isomerase-like protein